jgi:hypothetical protein
MAISVSARNIFLRFDTGLGMVHLLSKTPGFNIAVN